MSNRDDCREIVSAGKRKHQSIEEHTQECHDVACMDSTTLIRLLNIAAAEAQRDVPLEGFRTNS